MAFLALEEKKCFSISACVRNSSFEVMFNETKQVFVFQLLKRLLNLVGIFCFRPRARNLYSLTTQKRR